MNNQCRFLGRKEETAYCRKPKTWACPKGKISSCPCIPADFWNVATVPKKENISQKITESPRTLPEDMSHNKGAAATNIPAPHITKPVSIREMTIFKSS